MARAEPAQWFRMTRGFTCCWEHRFDSVQEAVVQPITGFIIRASRLAQWYKQSACHAEDAGLIPYSGRWSPFQYSCLGNPTDRGAWRATVRGVAKDSDMTLHLNSTSLHHLCIPKFSGAQFQALSRSVVGEYRVSQYPISRLVARWPGSTYCKERGVVILLVPVILSRQCPERKH